MGLSPNIRSAPYLHENADTLKLWRELRFINLYCLMWNTIGKGNVKMYKSTDTSKGLHVHRL